MSNRPVSRRSFVKSTLLTAASLPVAESLGASVPEAPPVERRPVVLPADGAPLRWLDGKAPALLSGATWGIPWPRGKHAKDTAFALTSASGAAVPLQSWPLAYWPDGSLKWTGHATNALAASAAELHLDVGAPAVPERPITVSETAGAIEVDTGVIRCRIAKRGPVVVQSITRDEKEIARDGRLVCLRQDAPELEVGHRLEEQAFAGEISSAIVEQRGPVRAVVRLEGKHSARGRAWLPFTLRLYLYAGGDSIRLLHTIVFDGDEYKDFIRGLGLRFAVPMRDQLHDRHVRFVGDEQGLFAEAVRGLTGLRRDPGRAVKDAQLAGRATPALDTWPAAVRTRMQYIPTFGDYTLAQSTADSFEIRKRTKRGYTWLSAAHGRRASGAGYVGGPTGGFAFGIRNFWQSFPAQLDVRNAATDSAEVTLWLWAPDAPAMDLRFYHDGMGQDTYAKQLEGLEITYEDYEPGFGTPMGVARTSEMIVWALPATPARERMVEIADAVRTPAVIASVPEYYKSAGIFGDLWALPDSSTPTTKRIESQLDAYIGYYQKQIDDRRWYGYWNFGDVKHAYDADRHEWRYDVGGYAWDNSELSTDIWLWYSYLRTGRADIFRMAEAMTRHTGEVDVHHIGRFAPLGSRHNVLHWGCSAKQARISTATNRRFYYYLAADERVGDLLREQLDADIGLVHIAPRRKVDPAERDSSRNPHPASMGFGTDWTSVAAAWLTEWERTGNTKYRDKLMAGMVSIGRMPKGWFSGAGGYEPATGMLYKLDDRVSVSHLNAVFGAVEINAEMLQLVPVPEYERAWLQYCELYNAPEAEQIAALGERVTGNSLRQNHSRLTAYAAHRKGDTKLAARAWAEFTGTDGGGDQRPLTPIHVTGPTVLNAIDEVPWVSTNNAAQWGLSAIQTLALIPEQVPTG